MHLLIIALVLILIIMGISFYTYRKIKRKVEAFSDLAFGTRDIVEGLQKVERESEVTPKSVSAGTGIYLPRIARDFPEFNFDEMKRRAENVLTSYLRGVDEMDASLLAEGTEELRNRLRMEIDMLRDAGRREH